jgi:hypothetical protein
VGESTFTRRGAGGGASVIKYTNAGTEIPVYGSVTKTTPPSNGLSSSRENLGGISFLNHFALFGGGFSNNPNARVAVVDAYTPSLVRSTPTGLSIARDFLDGTVVGTFALFGPGGGSGTGTVDAYNSSLTRTTPTGTSGTGASTTATNVGNFALFAGGSTTVNAYDTALTRTIPTGLSVSRNRIGATSIGGFALFGGGINDSFTTVFNTLDAYNTSLTRSNPNLLSAARGEPRATSVGSFALFGPRGDSGGDSDSTLVDAFNTSLTRSNPSPLSQTNGGKYSATTLLSNFAIFFYVNPFITVNSYDTSLTRGQPPNLNAEGFSSKSRHAAASIGSFSLVAGGNLASNRINQVEVYTAAVSSITYQLVTPQLSDFNITYKYDFTNIGTGTASEGQSLSSTTTFTGTLEFPEEIS